ncbi:MAG: GxxExxY protein [Candidatus Sigynarchaeota archaeon]
MALGKDELSAFCEEQGCAKAGNKETLIDRILGLGIDPDVLLELPSKPILKWACSVLGLKVGGGKDELKARIIEALHLAPKKQSKRDKPVSKETPKEEPKKPEPVPPVISPEDKFKQDLADLITFIKIQRPPKPKDESVFQNYFFGLLQGKYGHSAVSMERNAKGGSQRFDIVVWNRVIIETKVTGGRGHVERGIGQLMNYLCTNKNYTNGLLLVFNETSSRNLSSQFSSDAGDKLSLIFF